MMSAEPEWGGLIESVKEGKFLDEIWGGGGGTKLLSTAEVICRHSLVVFELFQKLHLQIYASQFMAS